MHNEIKTDFGILMAKKTERLVTALYLVTDLIIDTEPLKQSLRKNSITLLTSINALSQEDVKDRIIELKMSLRFVTEIISMLNVAMIAGLISEMNGGILIGGFRTLQVVLEKRQPLFTKEMLNIDEEDELNTNNGLVNAITSTSYDAVTKSGTLKHLTESVMDNKGHFSRAQDVKDSTTVKSHGHVIGHHTDKNINTVQGHQIKDNHNLDSSFQLRRHNRKDQILALFVTGVDINIKDISSRVRGCSEKTIQRELNNLVSDGKIDRIGEKRWSRYILR